MKIFDRERERFNNFQGVGLPRLVSSQWSEVKTAKCQIFIPRSRFLGKQNFDKKLGNQLLVKTGKYQIIIGRPRSGSPPQSSADRPILRVAKTRFQIEASNWANHIGYVQCVLGSRKLSLNQGTVGWESDFTLQVVFYLVAAALRYLRCEICTDMH